MRLPRFAHNDKRRRACNGRRVGEKQSCPLLARVADASDSYKHHKVDQAIKRLKAQRSNVEEAIFELENSFI